MKELVKNKSVSDWVYAYSDELYSWALFKTSSEDVAKDLVQETFVAAFDSFPTFKGKGEGSARAWLYSILRNKFIDHYRKSIREMPLRQHDGDDFMNDLFDNGGQWRKSERPHAWDDEKMLLDDEDFNTTFKGCLNNLPEIWHYCIKSKFFEQKESNEVCQALNITPSNLWQILHRAKLHLRKCLDQYWFNV
jgi:RNA polymerase sigma-70 factor (TIGR02943 family)